MAPFEAIYGRKRRTPLCWSDLDESLIIGPEMIVETMETIRRIREHIRVNPESAKELCRQEKEALAVSSRR